MPPPSRYERNASRGNRPAVRLVPLLKASRRREAPNSTTTRASNRLGPLVAPPILLPVCLRLLVRVP
jgi:hypothetical protein